MSTDRKSAPSVNLALAVYRVAIDVSTLATSLKHAMDAAIAQDDYATVDRLQGLLGAMLAVAQQSDELRRDILTGCKGPRFAGNESVDPDGVEATLAKMAAWERGPVADVE